MHDGFGAHWAGLVIGGVNRYDGVDVARVGRDRDGRLRNAEDAVVQFLEVAEGLGWRVGPLLFQLPPNYKKDLPRLIAFLKALRRRRIAFAFRHASWRGVLERLRQQFEHDGIRHKGLLAQRFWDAEQLTDDGWEAFTRWASDSRSWEEWHVLAGGEGLIRLSRGSHGPGRLHPAG